MTIDTATALVRLGGLASGEELREAVGRREFRRARLAGEIAEAVRGRWAFPAAVETTPSAVRVGGVVSHLSAAQHWGWKVRRPPGEPVVTVPRGRQLTEARRNGIDVRWADLPAQHIEDGVTSRVRTLIDCARTLPFDEALAVADSALREGRVTQAELVAAALASPRSGRGRAVRVAESADPLAANPFESVLRAIALDVPGLHVGTQGWVGQIGCADLTDPVLRIAVEAESFRYHGAQSAFNEDIRRYTAMMRLGWLVARFVYDDVMHRPDYVRAVLVDLVALRS